MYEKEGRFYFGVTKVEILGGKITGNCCHVFDYKVEQIVTIDGYRK